MTAGHDSDPAADAAQPVAEADHNDVGGFCSCCGTVAPCPTARRHRRTEPLDRPTR
jgi:hypothetical protein